VAGLVTGHQGEDLRDHGSRMLLKNTHSEWSTYVSKLYVPQHVP
jgi:hypothetical protein